MPTPSQRAAQKAGAKAFASALHDARALDEAIREERHQSERLAEECGEIEEDLEALKARFEMYFLGVERREPARERDEMKRRIGRLKGEFTRNTGLQFRIQTLNARYLSYERMWLRAVREKEAGTYRRDLQRARRHALEKKGEVSADPAAAAPAAPAVAPGPRSAAAPTPVSATDGRGGSARTGAAPDAGAAANAEKSIAPAVAPPAVARPAVAASPPRVPSGQQLPAGVSEASLRSLYEAYVEAKRRCNEDVSRCSYETLAKSVAKQVPELVAKYKARSVEFKVVIRDGHAILKAVPKL